MCEDTREGYLENNPNYIDHGRVKLLQFADGQTGALMVHGDPCFFTLVVGNKAFEFSDAEPRFYERDIKSDIESQDEPRLS